MVLLGLLSPMISQAQVNLFSEDFEGTGHQFTLNTTDLSSTASGSNTWLVNDNYTGGIISVCGLTSTNIPTTPSQTFQSNTTSTYMHLCSAAGVTAGVLNANFIASDGGLLCVNDENYFTEMSTDINASAYDTVELSFHYILGGSNATYGEVYYSTNGGSTWLLAEGNIFNQTTWALKTIQVPGNTATLRFGFRFVNTLTFSASEPAFGIDNVNVVGLASSSIAAPTFSGTSFCPGDQITINYGLTGSYSAGNQFTAELSDASGSFASPTNIGSVTATTATPITATIPSVAAGGQYRIRVVASNPNTTSPDNGVDISIAQGPVGGTASLSMDTVCAGAGTNVSLAGETGTIIWEESADGVNFVGSSNSGNSFAVNPNADLYLRAVVQNSCGADTSNVVHVVVRPTPIASFNYSQTLSGLDITFVNNTSGTYSSVLWSFGDGNQTINDSPTYSYSSPGSYVVSLTVTNDEGCSTSFTDTINVVPVAVDLLEDAIGGLNVFPNPAQAYATLSLELNDFTDLQVELLDVYGRQLQIIHNGQLPAGIHQIELNQLQDLAAGMYFVRVQSAQGSKTLKLRLE